MASLGAGPRLDAPDTNRYSEFVIPTVIRSAWRFAAPIYCLLATAAAHASTDDDWFTRSWQTDEGLPNNYVHAIAQGDDGYLWVGTPGGILRFDGIRFNPLPIALSGENDQTIHAILPRRGGGLWIVPTHGPLVGLNSELSPVLLPTNNLPKDTPLGMAEDNHGGLWIAYPNALYEVRDNHVTEIAPVAGTPAAGGGIAAVVCDNTDHIWMAKAGKVGVLQNDHFQQFAIPTSTRIIHLAPGRTGGVWVATGTHLYHCDAETNIQDFGSFEAGNPRAETWALMEDHAGGVWIGTDGSGLFRRDAAGFKKIEISHPFVLSLAEDREGNIWTGTAGGGLTRISPRGVQLEGVENGSSVLALQSLCEDTNGVLWGATQNGLLATRQNGKWQLALTNATTLGRVTCVAADRQGAVWIGTRDRRFHRWRNNALDTWTSREGLAQHSIVGWLPTTTGDLWMSEMGNPNVIQCLASNGQLRTFALPEGAGRVSALAEDATGHIWAASINGLLLRAESTGFRNVNTTPSAGGVILCLYATPDGALWIGYDGGGLGRLKDGRFTRVDSRHGLFDDHIAEIVTDDRDWFWFGSGRGIFKIQGKDLDAVMDGRDTDVRSIHYGRNEGLFSMEANSVNVPPFVSPTAFRSRDGSLWIPLRTATAVVNPKVLREDPGPPPVLLTRMAIDNQTVADYGDVRQAGSAANIKLLRSPLQVGPGPRKLDFDFTALNLTAPESVCFRCRLDGWDDDWYTPETRSATYTHLAAGTYHFRVQASNGDGAWSEAKIPFNIVVSPFFWQTWWFRAGILTLFTLAVVAAVRYVSFRRLRLKLRMVEQQASLDKERARIARDLHDDLGCRLTQVALTLNMADREIAEPAAASRQLHRCADMVRQVAGSVDEIVWAVNPRNDALRYVVDYISQFAVEFLHAADITCRLDLPDQIPDVPVSPEVRHNLFLVVKEALNNITRHARATEVRINITTDPAKIAITIEDNGCGFDSAPDNASADGLRNMRQRMEEIRGEFQLTSKPGAGTRVQLGCAFATQLHSQ